MLKHRRRLSLGLVILALVAVVTTSGYRPVFSTSDTQAYCALMPDSIGLYVNNKVTALGMPVGKVTGLHPQGSQVRVEFEIRADRRLPADVGATTVSRTLMADRELALVGNEPTGSAPAWDSEDCITKTATPRSITETLAAFSSLAEEINTDSGVDNVGTALKQLDRATTGTGEQINEIILGLGKALDSPEAAIGHLGNLLDALSELTVAVDGGWADIKKLLVRFPPTIRDVNSFVIGPSVDIVARLRYVLPMLNDVTTLFGGELVRTLDSIPNLPQLIGSGIESLSEAISMMPVYAGAFQKAIDPVTGAVGLNYAAPPGALPREVADQLCGPRKPGQSSPCVLPGPLSALIPAFLGSEAP